MSKGYSGLFQHTIGCQNKSIDFYVGSNGRLWGRNIGIGSVLADVIDF